MPNEWTPASRKTATTALLAVAAVLYVTGAAMLLIAQQVANALYLMALTVGFIWAAARLVEDTDQ